VIVVFSAIFRAGDDVSCPYPPGSFTLCEP